MTSTERQRSTAVERQRDNSNPWCIHDLRVQGCGICNHHPDLADSEFIAEMGNPETGWDWYGELGMRDKGTK